MPNYGKKFSGIYNKNVDKIYRFVFLKVGDKETTQDLTAQVFSKFLDKLRQGSEIENVNAYLYQIARAEIANHYRAKAKYKIVSIDAGEIIDDKAGQVEQEYQLSQDIIVLRQCLADLNDEEQNIIIWRYVEELPFKKIAQMTGKKHNTVRVIMHRALKELREKMENL